MGVENYTSLPTSSQTVNVVLEGSGTFCEVINVVPIVVVAVNVGRKGVVTGGSEEIEDADVIFDVGITVVFVLVGTFNFNEVEVLLGQSVISMHFRSAWDFFNKMCGGEHSQPGVQSSGKQNGG